MNEYEYYIMLDRSLEETKEWLEFGKSQKDEHLYFFPPRSDLMLRAFGERKGMSGSYYNATKEFNKAMLKVIKNDFPKLASEALDLMEKDKKEALSKCQSFVENLQKTINKDIENNPIHKSGGE